MTDPGTADVLDALSLPEPGDFVRFKTRSDGRWYRGAVVRVDSDGVTVRRVFPSGRPARMVWFVRRGYARRIREGPLP